MYLIDADVFIQAKNLHYGFDFCPGFWVWLENANADGTVGSVRRIQQELEAVADDLATWAHDHTSFFLDPDDEVATSLTQAAAWAQAQTQYRTAARAQFLTSGDYFLVAHAHAKGDTVVTHEVAHPDAVRRIPLPNACQGMSVPHTTIYEMLRGEGALFVLDG